MATLQELAEYCHVSPSTVSRALRDLPTISLETRERVRAAASALGYSASPSASGLRSGRHRVVAIAAPPLGPWFYSRVIRGIESVLHGHDYRFFLIDTAVEDDGSRRQFSRSSIEKRSDAVIALGIDLTATERHDLEAVGKPVVVVGAAVPGLPGIGIDDAAAADMAMRHLLELGHRRIAHLGGDDDYGIENAVALTRRARWASRLEQAGITPRPEMLVSGGFTLPESKAAALRLLQDQRPTAIFAASDEMAFGAILAARQLGIVLPAELSIVGIDDHVWSEAFGLTTVHQDPYAQGVAAAVRILDELGGTRGEPTFLRSPISFVVRESTAPPRAPDDPGSAPHLD